MNEVALMNREKLKKVGKIAMDVLTYIFLALCIFTVMVTILSKKDVDGAAEVFGYQMRVVTSDSMAECEFTNVSNFEIKDIPLRSMIFVKTIPDSGAEADEWYRSLKVGDVLTFRYVYTTQVTITHRIVSITEKETGGFVIDLAGDNKNSESGQLFQTIDTSVPNNPNYVIGKVVGQSYLVGVIMSFLKQPIAIVLVIILPCSIIILSEVLKIVKVMGEDKRKREQEESAKRDTELEELRVKLAALENQSNPTQESPTPPNEDGDSSDSNSDSEQGG